MSSPTPNTDMHGWRLAIPIRSYSREGGDPGIIARFEIPIE